MADVRYRSGFRFYQSANADAEAIKAGFIIRRHEYDIILQDIRRNPMKGSVQHYLLLGRRGSGKSTLLKRIQVEIDTDKQLSKTHIAINLAEEQANIYKLYDLLEAVIRELEYRSIESDAIGWEEDEHIYSRNLFTALHKAVEKSGKKLVLLLDNIDRIFENLDEGASLLREYLLNYDDIKIIGGSTRMTEHFWKYNRPFYQFFRVLELKPLTSEEIKTLLLHWAAKLELTPLKEFVETRTGQLEMVRILTDGLPRTLQFFVDILLKNSEETGYEYLRQIMDHVTPLYQERLNNLPPSQRKIVLQMAFLWEAAGAKELSAATHMDNKVISAQLKQLCDKGVAEKIETKTKNHLYRLSERFFNLWLIFTQGSPHEKRKAKHLTVFLENFYDTRALQQMADTHLEVLLDKKIMPGKAALITKALAQSKYITSTTRDALISGTLNLEGVDIDLKQQLPLLSATIWNEVLQLTDKKQFDKALKAANEFEQEDGMKIFMLGYIYGEKGDESNAEKYYLQAAAKGDVKAVTGLGLLYDKQGKIELAEKYYLQAIENGNSFCLELLAWIYYSKNINKAIALEYVSKAVNLKPDDPISQMLYILINLWNGEVEMAAGQLAQLVKTESYNLLDFVLLHFLIHGQYNLMQRLFTEEVSGRKLAEGFAPIFYATGLLLKDETLQLKIPPELTETVEFILQEVKEGRAFYYGNS
jgi:TPR repeat protein